MCTAAIPEQGGAAGQLTWSVVSSALVLVGLAGWLLGFAAYVGDPLLAPAMALAFGLLGPWVARRGVAAIGHRMTLVGVTAAVSWAAQGWSRITVVSWLSQWCWELPVLLVPLVLVRFPTGTIEPRWRWIEPVLVITSVVPVMLLAVAALGAPNNLLTGGTPRPGWTAPLVSAAIAASAGWLLACLATGVLLVSRAAHSPGRERAQIICLGVGLLVLLAAIGLLIAGAPTAVEIVAAVALPAALAAAVLRYALWDLDLLVNRVLVWLGLTVTLAIAFVGLVAAFGEVLPGNAVRAPELIALLVIALLLEPVRCRLQSAVDHLLFGRRSAPAEAFAIVSRDLGRAAKAGSGEIMCHAIAATLRLPWVGIQSTGGTVCASWGRQIADVRSFPLVLGDVSVGELTVCPRRVKEPLTREDRIILSGMAAQVAVAVQAMALAEDLNQARERVAASRETERQRLRNDLHDGLGPALVGLRMQATYWSRQTDAPAITAALGQMAADAALCVAEVNRVVEGLRPAALEMGLTAALRAEAQRLADGSTSISVTATPGLGPIPSGSELAAYRIASEAMNNAVRHASASQVRIELRESDTEELLVQICDDGTGLGPARSGSVGLESMRQRAEDAGGVLTIGSGPGGGTSVIARLPLGHAGRATDALG